MPYLQNSVNILGSQKFTILAQDGQLEGCSTLINTFLSLGPAGDRRSTKEDKTGISET